jgi:ferredoxin
MGKSVLPVPGPWAVPSSAVPESLRGRPGTLKLSGPEQEAFAARPLPNFHRLHHTSMEWVLIEMWRSLLPSMPRFLKAHRRAGEMMAKAGPVKTATDDVALTKELRELAARIGLSAVGVAAQDAKYVFAEFQDTVRDGDRVVVAMLEQNWAATQTAPSARSEKAAFATYAELLELTTRLAAFLVERGYRAHVHSTEGEGLAINFAMEAGLGQLGLNGQLLTPAAGSRARIKLITTNAPLVLDQRQDFGVERLCDACQACVRRCPSGAITSVRKQHRGVVKAKINTSRCLPVVAQADGCAICMKVCPVQRYGLERIWKHWEATGEVLGRGTDELEAYDWIDGRRYRAAERPRLEPAFFRPRGLDFDANRAPDPEAAAAVRLFSDQGVGSD